MKQTIILGNIITMDKKRPFAKAAIVKNGVFVYIGSADEARRTFYAAQYKGVGSCRN